MTGAWVLAIATASAPIDDEQLFGYRWNMAPPNEWACTPAVGTLRTCTAPGPQLVRLDDQEVVAGMRGTFDAAGMFQLVLLDPQPVDQLTASLIARFGRPHHRHDGTLLWRRDARLNLSFYPSTVGYWAAGTDPVNSLFVSLDGRERSLAALRAIRFVKPTPECMDEVDRHGWDGVPRRCLGWRP